MTSDPHSMPAIVPPAAPYNVSSLLNIAERNFIFSNSSVPMTNTATIPEGVPVTPTLSNAASVRPLPNGLPTGGNILRRLLCHQSPADIQMESAEPRLTNDSYATHPSQMPTDLFNSAYRPRSQSMIVTYHYRPIPEITASESRDSLDCSDDCEVVSVNGIPEPTRTDQLIEVARRRLLLLNTHGDDEPQMTRDDRISTSQPGSPPKSDAYHPDRMRQHRKFSEGSQLKARLQAMRTGFRTPVDPVSQSDCQTPTSVAVDLSRRRRKFEGITGLPYGRRLPGTGYAASGTSNDEGIGDDCGSERSSILKSILIGRGRANTFSGSGSRLRPDLSVSSSDFSTGDFQRYNGRTPVTLAKKNLHPVTSKISDCLNRVIAFVRSLPEFMGLSANDQRTLMSAALHRLLLLFMAESNVNFVVVPVHQTTGETPDLVEEGESGSSAGSSTPVTPAGGAVPLQPEAGDVPTFQFAESVRNFVTKCQSLGITAEEYSFMRIITLFQSAGSGTLEMSSVVDKLSTSARRDLQLHVERTHPSEALHRYSTLLLTMHTLYGVHCGMLEALFCRPLTAKTPANTPTGDN